MGAIERARMQQKKDIQDAGKNRTLTMKDLNSAYELGVITETEYTRLKKDIPRHKRRHPKPTYMRRPWRNQD